MPGHHALCLCGNFKLGTEPSRGRRPSLCLQFFQDPSGGMSGADVNILLADDEANILMLLEMELQAEGYRTVCCADGGKALAQIREDQPSLALLDWNMPVISGLDVCRRRRRQTSNPLITGMFQSRSAREG